MTLLDTIWRSNFLIKLRNWEYWPFGVVYAPVFIYWLWLSFKARSLFFFSASNPSIENGGMLGESKIKIFELIPDSVKPVTLYFKKDASLESISTKMKAGGLSYPVIAKPNIGERGWMVKKINNASDLQNYLHKVPIDFLIQEFLNSPIELGVFYYRYPTKEVGEVTSIVRKEMLFVVGDGMSTLGELVYQSDRAKLQLDQLQATYHSEWNLIVPNEEAKELVSIGNHCLGTKFLNENYLINHQIHKTFDVISKKIKGFYFGRYDIRVNSIDDLYNGEIKIMELNGAGAEPAHIYDPNYSFVKGVRVLLRHWKILYTISIQNHQKGIPYLSWQEGRAEYKKVQALNRLK